MFHSLPPERQWQVHLRLCEEALSVWTTYVAECEPLCYIDSVVGVPHEVDVHLPYDALRSAELGVDVSGVQERYGEPIVAIQDDDLGFPEKIEFAYYAIYNCFRRYVLGNRIDPWLIVNQALSSIVDETSWSPRLTAVIAATAADGKGK